VVRAHRGAQRAPSRVVIEGRVDDHPAGPRHLGGADRGADVLRIARLHDQPGGAARGEDVRHSAIRRGAHQGERVALRRLRGKPPQRPFAGAANRNPRFPRLRDERVDAGFAGTGAHEQQAYRRAACEHRGDLGGRAELCLHRLRSR
jgi:hypothetical protein